MTTANPTAGDRTRDLLTAGLDRWKIRYTADQIEQFLTYRDLLVEWNAGRMNLTRLVDPSDIALEHFLDSLSLLTVAEIPKGAMLLDIGAGAGFPSLPLKILRPDLKITLLEATTKKLTFCRALVEALKLDRVRLIHGRAEQPQQGLARQFDVVTARAVAPLEKLIPWCDPYLKPRGGVIAAWKGARAGEELAAAQKILRQLALTAELKSVEVPGSEKAHAIVICRK